MSIVESWCRSSMDGDPVRFATSYRPTGPCFLVRAMHGHSPIASLLNSLADDSMRSHNGFGGGIGDGEVWWIKSVGVGEMQQGQ